MHPMYRALYLCLGLVAQPLAAEPGLAAQTAQPYVPAGQYNEQHSIGQLISQAITEFEQRARADWSYRLSRYENEEGEISRSIALFEPTKALSAAQCISFASFSICALRSKPYSRASVRLTRNDMRLGSAIRPKMAPWRNSSAPSTTVRQLGWRSN